MFHFVNVILHNIYIVNDSRESRPGTCSMVLKVFNCARRFKIQRDSFHQDPFSYSETTPYGHLGNTVTSVLQPLSFGGLAKTAIHFLVKKKTLVFTAIFFGPLVTVLRGFHCISTSFTVLLGVFARQACRGISFHALVLCSKPPPLTFMIARIGLATRLLKSQILVNN